MVKVLYVMGPSINYVRTWGEGELYVPPSTDSSHHKSCMCHLLTPVTIRVVCVTY